MKKLNIMVTGVGGPAGVNICKLLLKQKKYFNIFAQDINSHSAGQFFSHQFFLGERVTDEKKYIDFMANFIVDKKIDILIPTVAEELVLMQKLKDKLGSYKCEIIVSEQKALELCDEKDKLYAWMDKNFPQYMGKWIRLRQGFGGHGKDRIWNSGSYFIKPIKGRGSRGCRLVTKIELQHLLKNSKSEMKNFIAMEVLPGREWTVDTYVNDDGSFAYIVPRLRLGLSGGISQIGKTDRNGDVIEQTKKVFEKMNTESKIRGPVFIQWKESAETDKQTKKLKIKMVEINPRASGGLTITALSGADPMMCLKTEIINKKKCINLKWKEVVVTRYFEEKIVK